MRTLNLTTSGPSRLQLTVYYPNSIAFMYSRQPLIVTSYGNPGALTVAATVTHIGTGRSHTESRKFYGHKVEFDLSRIMQLLAPDVDTLLRRLDYDEGKSLSEAFSLSVSYVDTDGASYTILDVDDITALYGTLDQGEIYGEHTQRRLWVNFPQTFNLWKDENNEVAFVTGDSYIYPDKTGNGPCYECDFMGTLLAIQDQEEIDAAKPGRVLHNVGLTWRTRIENGEEISEEFRTITLIPDACRPQDGTYLRWLNRRGEVSYWLFRNSQIRVTSAVRDTFGRHYDGDPAIPTGDVFNNELKTDYREARELVLVAIGLSRDEFDDLCDLATSPVVERLMPKVTNEDTEVDIVYDGGNARASSEVIVQSADGLDTEVEAGDARTALRAQGPHIWQRVNVAAGTYARNIRRATPNRQDFEIIIELPERNSIRL